jgi:nucleoside-diphosphate-sugar epimerase
MTRKLFCFGLGYSALALARRLRRDGWKVGGTTRAREKADALQREGCDIVMFDGRTASADVHDRIRDVQYILVSTPPGDSGDPVLASRVLGVRAFRWLGYLSTTGVYGNTGGAWVDETTTPAPSSPRAARRLAAEIAWQVFAAETGAPLHIFRLPGIYGPGRSALDPLRAGTARHFDKPEQVFSRIHVDDLANALAASMARPSPGAVYNVCDDEPAPQSDVIVHGAKLLGIPPPPLEPFAEAESFLSEMARSFYRDSKRVRNDKIKRELGISLAFPTYREGLSSLMS